MEIILNIITIIVAAFFIILGAFIIGAIFKIILVVLGIDKD